MTMFTYYDCKQFKIMGHSIFTTVQTILALSAWILVLVSQEKEYNNRYHEYTI